MKRKTKLIGYIMGIVFFIVTVSASTYAWYKWRSSLQQTVNINLTASSIITFYGGTDIEGELEPVLDKEDGILKTIGVTSDVAGNSFSLYMDIDSLPEELQSTAFLWAIYKGNEYLNGNDFSNYETGDADIVLLDNVSISTSSTDQYTIYYWIDGNVVNNNDMMGKTVSLYLHAIGTTGAVNEVEE